jgi:hypothetical protein
VESDSPVKFGLFSGSAHHSLVRAASRVFFPMATVSTADIPSSALPKTLASPGTSLVEFSLKATAIVAGKLSVVAGGDAGPDARRLVGADLSSALGHFSSTKEVLQDSREQPKPEERKRHLAAPHISRVALAPVNEGKLLIS